MSARQPVTWLWVRVLPVVVVIADQQAQADGVDTRAVPYWGSPSTQAVLRARVSGRQDRSVRCSLASCAPGFVREGWDLQADKTQVAKTVGRN